MLFQRYQDYQSYVGWSAADEERVRAAGGILRPQLQPLIEDFYDEISRHAETRKILEQGQTMVERLKEALGQWLRELLSGPYDREYVGRRWQVGKRHLEVGVEQVYVSAALARMRAGLGETLSRNWPDKCDGLVSTILALNKLLDLDLAIIEHAYQTEYAAQIRRHERIAQVGEVAGSVGHELRDPLNVMRTSAYYLRTARNPPPAKMAEHFQRIDRHAEVAEQVLLELSEFVRMPPPQARPFPVGACVDEALEKARLGEGIRLAREFPPALAPAWGDADQIRHAFVLLIRRAGDNMHNCGRLSIRGRPAGDAVEVIFEDSGPRLAPPLLAALQGPLSWANVRALRMTLAVNRAILHWNGGRLRAEDGTGPGCTMIVTLPQALQRA